eukprot:NODE_96_length_21330_cov_0.419858.p10 type:complete len:123 gc:universal NODE_96_length_21330_cov_0.419858:7715-8083(+)
MLKILLLTPKESYIVRKMVVIFKIPKYTMGYALCYYQDIGISSFKMFVLCLLIAHKFMEDYKIRSSTWSKYTNIDKYWLIANEIIVLQFFDYQMNMPQERVIAAVLNCINEFYPVHKYENSK